MPTLDCIMPNLLPIQLRGPIPNGIYVYGFIESRLAGENRSGSNFNGFGKYYICMCKKKGYICHGNESALIVYIVRRHTFGSV